jgi:hypothetical protein
METDFEGYPALRFRARLKRATSAGQAQTSEVQKPAMVYPLALAGLILEALGLVFFGAMFGVFLPTYRYYPAYHTGMMGGYWGMMGGYVPFGLGLSWFGAWLAVGIVAIALGVYGVRLVSSTDLSKIHTGSVLLLVSAVIAFPSMWGFFAGSALLFVASILGLVWQPETRTTRLTPSHP